MKEKENHRPQNEYGALPSSKTFRNNQKICLNSTLNKFKEFDRNRATTPSSLGDSRTNIMLTKVQRPFPTNLKPKNALDYTHSFLKTTKQPEIIQPYLNDDYDFALNQINSTTFYDFITRKQNEQW